MPVIKSAKKKLRKDKKREVQNKQVRNTLKLLIKKAKVQKSEKAIREAVRTADKAAKNHIIHANKAARIKSTLAKLLDKKISAISKTTSTPKKNKKKTPAAA